MERFRGRFTRRRVVGGLLFALLGYFWRGILWLAEQVAGDWAVRMIDQYLSELPDVVSGKIIWVQNNPTLFAVSTLIILVVAIFLIDSVRERAASGNAKEDDQTPARVHGSSALVAKLVFGNAYVEAWDMNKVLLVPEGPAVTTTTTTTVSLISTSPIVTSSPAGKFEIIHPVPLGKYDIAFVDVSASGAEEIKGVTARPTFYSPDGARIKHSRIFSRWWEKAERAESGEAYRDLRQIAIQEANPALLVFAFVPQKDKTIYAYDHTAHSENVHELKRKGTDLGAAPVVARIAVQGIGGVGPFDQWFRLRLDQAGHLIAANISPPAWVKKEEADE